MPLNSKVREVISGKWLEFVFGLSSLIGLIIVAVVTILGWAATPPGRARLSTTSSVEKLPPPYIFKGLNNFREDFLSAE